MDELNYVIHSLLHVELPFGGGTPMIDDLIQQLRDRNPAVRRQAIIALGKSKDIAALRPLADVFRGDADTDLRELARKAGLYIRQQNPNAMPPPRTPTPSDSGLRRRSLSDISASVRGDDDASDIKAAKRIEQYQRRQQTPLDADEGDAPPPRFGAARFGSDDRTLAEIDTDDDPDDLGAYLDDTPDDEPINYKPTSMRRGRSAAAVGALGMGDDGEVEDAPTPPAISLADYGFVRGKEYTIDKEDRARARKNIDVALSMEEQGKNDKALKTLAAALKLDPNLINDGFFNSVASTITGKDGDEAVAVLISGEKRAEAMKSSQKDQKKKRADQHSEKVSGATSSGLLFELFVFFLVNGIGTALIFVISVQGLVNFATQLIESAAASDQFSSAADSLEQVQTLAQAFNAVIVVAVLLIFVFSGLGAVFVQFFQAAIIHLVAGLFGGRGRFVYQLTTVTAVYNKFLPFLFVLICVISTLVFVTPYALLCGSIFIPLLTMFISIKGSQKIGEAYAFGAGMGCLAYIVSTVIIYVIYFTAGALFSSGIGQLLQSLIDANLASV